MLQIRMGITDLGRTRFAYSPLAEVAESLYMLASGRIPPPHRGWFSEIRGRLARVDVELLHAVVPDRRLIVDFLFVGAEDPNTTIERQLGALADIPADQLRKEIEEVWHGDVMPPRARQLISDGPAAPRRLADALWKYWVVAIEPHWRTIRAVLDDDVASRVAELRKGGVNAMLGGLHAEISMRDEQLCIDKKAFADQLHQWELPGTGLLLVPSVFVWPRLMFVMGSAGPPSLTYAARGVGNFTGARDTSPADEDALGALLGRSRAEILVALALPQTTTELAVMLKQSPSSVSQHLSVLKGSGLVTSWRSGRRVLYRRTDLATSVVEANSVRPGDRADLPA